jgi:1-acyl-sn-glycerol-3-phosphate acyltransferase
MMAGSGATATARDTVRAMFTAEPRGTRWKRRARTIPAMLCLTAVAVITLPVIVVVAAGADLVRLRARFPTVRVALFLVQYGVNDSVEILLAGPLWVVAGFGRRLREPVSMRRHERVQAWSLDVLARRAERLLGLRVAVDPATLAALTPGPVIVLGRHVNLVDASLPSLLYQRLGMRTRGAIMAELLADPGFDLIYGRTGSVFIPRDDAVEARRIVEHLADGVDRGTAVVIFPEGRLFREEVLHRALARLADTNPERFARLSEIRHVLPPRPGGVLALLDALPGVDVVVVAHTGLDRFASFRELARAVPLVEPIRCIAWRIPSADIPNGPEARIRWLDERWLLIDQHVRSVAGESAGATRTSRSVERPH